MRVIRSAIIHCAYTKASMDIGAMEIRRWHIDDRGWSDIGYHYVIRRDGELENGRPVAHVGAHCKGHNRDSIGICLVGGMNDDGAPEFNFTADQFATLRHLKHSLDQQYHGIEWHGHREYSDKACPCFDVGQWFL